VSAYIRDFRGLREVRVLGKGSTGVVKLLEDPSTHGLIAVKFFDSAVAQASDGSSAFFREIDALVLLAYPCVLWILGYCLATWQFPAQIGMEFAAGGSLREALPRLDDTGKAIVICGVVVGMKFIHSRGVVHRDLKPENIMLDEQGHPKIDDLGSSRFCNLRLTLTSAVGAPLYMAPEMYSKGGYTTAVDTYSFALILYEVLVGERVFPATTTLPVLFASVSQGHRQELPADMKATVRQIIKRGWSVDPDPRDSFESIFDALRRIEFKIRTGVDTRRVTEYLALVEGQAAWGPMADTTKEAPPELAVGVRSGRGPQEPPGRNQEGTAPEPPPNITPPPPEPGPVKVNLSPLIAPPKQAHWFAPSPRKANWFALSIPLIIAVIVLVIGVILGLADPSRSAPPKQGKQFPPSIKKKKTRFGGRQVEIGVPDGIIVHLTWECGGNVHDRQVVEVTSGSFEKETQRPAPHAGEYDGDRKYMYAAKNVADLEIVSYFHSAFRNFRDDIQHTRNNWICYDFRERKIVPTHYNPHVSEHSVRSSSEIVAR
jgi:serine/threonine protein kinase